MARCTFLQLVHRILSKSRAPAAPDTIRGWSFPSARRVDRHEKISAPDALRAALLAFSAARRAVAGHGGNTGHLSHPLTPTDLRPGSGPPRARRPHHVGSR